MTRIALGASVGLTPELAASLEIPWISFGAVRADGALESLDRALGAASQRESFPRGRFLILRQSPGGQLEFDDRAPAAGLGDATLGLSWRRGLGGRTSLAATLVLKLPTGSAGDYRGSGSVDAGLLAGAARRFGAEERWGLRLEAAAVRPGRFRGDTPAGFHVSTFLRVLGAADARLGERTTLSLAAVVEESPERAASRGDSSRTSAEVSLGVSRRLGRGLALDLGLTENLPRYGDAADLAVVVRLRRGR